MRDSHLAAARPSAPWRRSAVRPRLAAGRGAFRAEPGPPAGSIVHPIVRIAGRTPLDGARSGHDVAEIERCGRVDARRTHRRDRHRRSHLC